MTAQVSSQQPLQSCHTAQRAADPHWQTRGTSESLESHPILAEEEQKEVKGESLNMHQCLTA